MNGVILQYRRLGWKSWSVWKCKNEAEAVQIRRQLESEGYEVRG